MRPDGRPRTISTATITVAVLVVLALIFAIALAFMQPIPRPEPVVVTETTTVSPQPSTLPSRPTAVDVPDSATVAIDAPAGDFNAVWRDNVSEAFAVAVRDEFVRAYFATNDTEHHLRVYSPHSGQVYNVNCTDDGELVRCDGATGTVFIG